MRWCLCLCMLIALPAMGQDLVRTPGILANDVSNLHIEGHTLWVGPYLNVTRDGGDTWEAVDTDSLRGLNNSIYSIDIEQETLWAGLGNQFSRINNTGQRELINLARGLLRSADAGASWTYVSHLPPNDNDPRNNRLVRPTQRHTPDLRGSAY